MKESILIVSAVAAFLLFVWIFTFGSWRISRFFNLVEKRSVMGEEQYNKMSIMFMNGDVRLSSNWYDNRVVFYIYADYKDGSATVSNVFKSDNVSTVVDQAFEWSDNHGFIKER